MHLRIKYHNAAGADGFALPVAIGMGLIMLLIGVTVIVRSHNDRISASSQSANARSLAAAEAGVSKLQAFLNRYRALATYPSTGSTPAWDSNPNAIVNLYADCATIGNNITTELAQVGFGGDVNVAPGDPTQGQYRLVGYDYPLPGQTGSVGTLKVRGMVNAGLPNQAVSQIEVDFPVNTRQGRIPAIWVPGTGAVTNAPQLSSDVMGGCSAATLDASVAAGSMIVRSDLSMPSVPPKPPSSDLISLPSMPATLPRGTDQPVGGKFFYSVPQLDSSVTVETNNLEVHIWVDGEINLEGHTVRQNCSGNPACSPLNLKIYGADPVGNNITLNEASVVCDVLFHAPTYDLSFNTGGTAAHDCADVPLPVGSNLITNSAYWVNTWNGATGSVTLGPPQANWLDADIPLLPQLAPIARWETQEAVD